MSRGDYIRCRMVLLVILVTFCHNLYAYIPPSISHMRIRSPIILQQRSITSTTRNQRDVKQLGRLWSTTNEDNAVENNNDMIKGDEIPTMVTKVESNSGNSEMPSIVQKAIRYLQLIATIVSESAIWRKYSSNLSVKPVLTKSFSSMLGFLVGDLIAQMITRKVIHFHSDHTTILTICLLYTSTFFSRICVLFFLSYHFLCHIL